MEKNTKKTKNVNNTKKVKKNELVMPKKNNTITYILFAIAIVVTIILAEYFTTKKVDDIVLSQLNYFETASTDFKVFYKDVAFKDKDYYVCDNNHQDTCVTQFVDEIKATFNYYNSYSEDIDGTYSYYVKATLKVFEPGKEENVYWSPEYDLTDKETVDFNKKGNYRISKDITIDYEKYLEEYNKYKSKSAISTNAKLIVKFIVKNDGEYPGLNSIAHDANLVMEIPLSEQAFNISLSNSIKSEEQKIVNLEDNQADRIFTKIIAGLCWLFVVLLSAILFIVYRTNVNKESLYSRKLKKILNTYDSIIVNVESLPKTNDLSVVNVTTFEELVDAQMEVRLPINFKEDTKKHIAKFVLVRNNLAWVYTLEEGKEIEK